MGKKRDDSGAKVKVRELKKGQVLPSPFDDERYLIDEAPEFVLIPLLATDPLPYLFNQVGEPVDVDGRSIDDAAGDTISPAIRELQDKLWDEMNSGVGPEPAS